MEDVSGLNCQMMGKSNLQAATIAIEPVEIITAMTKVN